MVKANTLYRIKQFVDEKGITNKEFESKIGFSNGGFSSQLRKNKTIGVDKLENILSVYSEINPEWLLTGKGSMLKEAPSQSHEYSDGAGIPLVPIDAIADWGKEDAQLMDYETKRYVVPEFDELKVDFMIRIKGNSMYPSFTNGDLVACKKLPTDTFLQWHKVYVLDTIQGAMIKRVHPSDKEDHILCVSDNESFNPFDLATKEMYSLAIVVGIIRFE